MTTIQALLHYAKTGEGKSDWIETAEFLQTIRNWWNIVNVKTPSHGWKKRQDFLKPVSTNVRDNALYLNEFSSWMEEWEKKSAKKGLTKETFLAMRQTTKALAEMCSYVLEEEDFSYVLLGQSH